ncbi:phosphonate ABC transporter, permease protein PhnE [Bacillus aquiflavi]|uniref:phosphonate ABC transporter, permease protein PhnE n=1 Tax=Bacillus aquiflavi TaxID=2672567 RepID=UPI001CA9E2B1|nr:phosphonate ABC transporter, permease protein PhnE [Bacillus aquiflavi]UAC48430.1 phosphonate ABC transporter, permease protein PhnE [Bacillus aquiflavi]
MSEIAKNTISKPPRKTKHIFTLALVVVLAWGSAVQTESSFKELWAGLPNMWDLLVEMFPPDWGYFSNIKDALLETIRMAVLGTTFGAILAIPISLLSAGNIVKIPFLYQTARFILNLIRTIPDLLLAAIFVAIFGIGPFAGMLALTFFSLGIIAKLTFESIESIDPGPLEAMTASGANKIQWIHFGVIPQVTPHFISYVLYTFEVNIRAAAILGYVGAGGIGQYYEKTLGFLQYDRTNAIIIYTLVVILIIDYISTKLREKLV